MTDQAELLEDAKEKLALRGSEAEAAEPEGGAEIGPPDPHTLAWKLLKARMDVGRVDKRGQNRSQNYKYVMAEDVAATAERALQGAGLVVNFETVGTEDREIASKGGGRGMIVKATCRMTVIDPETGTKVELAAIGYGSDYPGDKAVYKAITGARKYALIHLLGIDVGDDPEAETGADRPTGGGQELAADLFKRASGLGLKDQLRLAASHVAGRDVGDCGSRAKAVQALSGLTVAEMERLNGWLSRKADERAGKEGSS